MTDYSKLSDFEINKLVAESVGLSMDNGYGFIDSESNLVCYDVISGSGGETRAIEVRVNYCNNPSDAWPIIESFKCAFSSDTAYEPKTGITWYKCENRLRAAMIVYLMIQEQNND